MKKIIVSFLIVMFFQAGLFAFECPKKPAQGALAIETDLDCPWAGAARLLIEKAGNTEPLDSIFSKYTPGIVKQLGSDNFNSEALELWGESLNFDAIMKAKIVHSEILAFMAFKLGLPAPKGQVVHAGMEHTYGYLFSVLETKYGFKRSRWVRGYIENGLGLEKGILGPKPSEGSLLSNITCFAGNIALSNDSSTRSLFQSLSCPDSLQEYAKKKIKRLRLLETVELSDDRTVILRTDFVPFIKLNAGGDFLLIYSVYDSKIDKAKLITLFPVRKSFIARAIASDSLGENQPIKTRYNAWVDGFSGKTIKGFREVFLLDN